MTNRSSHYVKGPIVSILAALSVAAFGCLGEADAAEPRTEPAAEASAELAPAPGATNTIRTTVLYLQDAGHIAGTLAVGELTDPAGPDFGETLNYIDEAELDLETARELIEARDKIPADELDRLVSALRARQKAREARYAARHAARLEHPRGRCGSEGYALA